LSSPPPRRRPSSCLAAMRSGRRCGRISLTKRRPIHGRRRVVRRTTRAPSWGATALRWPMPERVPTYRVSRRTNGLTTPAGSGLLGGLTYWTRQRRCLQAEMQGRRHWHLRANTRDGIPIIAKATLALERLLTAMWPKIDLPRASAWSLHGGRLHHGTQWRSD
jgi:hypothetical protein